MLTLCPRHRIACKRWRWELSSQLLRPAQDDQDKTHFSSEILPMVVSSRPIRSRPLQNAA